MTEDEMIEHGKELFEKCYDGIVPLPEPVDPKAITGISLKMFHDVWGNEDLSFRDKRLVVLGALIGLGADKSLFEIHASSAINNGELTGDELRAVLLTAIPYCGYPRASILHPVVEACIPKMEARRAERTAD